MTTALSDADNIRRQMAQIRAAMHTEMRGVVEGATAATDWRAYIYGHPWLAIGVAFGAGFLLVPRRRVEQRIVVQPAASPSRSTDSLAAPSPAPKKRFGLLGWAFGAIAPIALRAAQSYALTQVEKLLIDNPLGSGPAPNPQRAGPFPSTAPTGPMPPRRG